MKNKTMLAAVLAGTLGASSVDAQKNNINTGYDNFSVDTNLVINDTKTKVDKLKNFEIVTNSSGGQPDVIMTSADGGFEDQFINVTDIPLTQNQPNSIDLNSEFIGGNVPSDMTFLGSTFEGQGGAVLPPITQYDINTGMYSGPATNIGVFPTTHTASFTYEPTGDTITYVNDNTVTVSIDGGGNPNNLPPVINNITSTGSISLGETVVMNVNITDDNLSNVTWSLSGTTPPAGTLTFSQINGVGDTFKNIEANGSITSTGYTITLTVVDGDSIQTFVVYNS